MPEWHISDDDLDRYALGALPHEALAGAEEHLLVCESCQTRLREADQFAVLFRGAAVQPDARRRRSWWAASMRRPAFAVATAAVFGGVLLVVAHRDSPPMEVAVVSMQSLRGPTAAAQVKAGAPSVLVFELEMEAARNPYEVRIVDLDGAEVLKLTPSSKDGRVAVKIDGLRRGSYWARVYRSGELIAEYGLQAK